MGMDISGINPKINKSISDYPILDKWSDITWGERTRERKDEWKADQEQYYKEDDEYNKGNKGIYFRNNCWWWRPLWHYCCVMAEDIISDDTAEAGCYNDGAGLNDEDSIKLSIKLHTLIADGHTQKWKEERDLHIEQLPPENCGRCNNNNRGKLKKKECLACDKVGTKENFQSNYPFDVENVRAFADFLCESGGFEIW